MDFQSGMVSIYVDGNFVVTFPGDPAINGSSLLFADFHVLNPGDDRIHLDDNEIYSRVPGPLTFPVGTVFCNPANANSTGLSTTLTGVELSGVGSGLYLEASQGVPGQVG